VSAKTDLSEGCRRLELLADRDDLGREEDRVRTPDGGCGLDIFGESRVPDSGKQTSRWGRSPLAEKLSVKTAMTKVSLYIPAATAEDLDPMAEEGPMTATQRVRQAWGKGLPKKLSNTKKS
jgi:hypothetical protein